MSELTNKLHLKNGSTVYECTCYTTTDEATPNTISGGSCWELKNNNTVCYIGLWPTSVSGGTYHTPLKLKKGGVEYYVETKVVNTFRVTITQSSNQTITVTCNGTAYTSSFDAPAGAAYTVTVTPATGYTAGAPSSASGNVTEAITVTASAATKKTYKVTISPGSNQTITVTCGGTKYTSTFTAEHGATWTATIAGATGYNPGTLSATSGTVTGAVTISATAATKKTYTVTISQKSNETVKVTCGGTTYTSSFTATHGATWAATVTPSNGYKAGALSPGSSGTITGAITITAGAATSRDGELIASGTSLASFTVPSGVSYVSICAVHALGISGNPKYPGSQNGAASSCCVMRVKVSAGTTYSNLATMSGYDSTYTYGTGTKIYNNHSSLGNIPSSGTGYLVSSTGWNAWVLSCTHYAVYVDDGSGTVYTDSTVRAKYTELTGSSIPA